MKYMTNADLNGKTFTIEKNRIGYTGHVIMGRLADGTRFTHTFGHPSGPSEQVKFMVLPQKVTLNRVGNRTILEEVK